MLIFSLLATLLPLTASASAPATDEVTLPAAVISDAADDAAWAEFASDLLTANAGDTAITAAQRSHLLLVAHRWGDAAASIEEVQSSLAAKGEAGRAPRWLPYLIVAKSRQNAGDVTSPAYAESFAATFKASVVHLDDVAAVQAHYSFVGDADAVLERVRQDIRTHAGTGKVSRDQALELVRLVALVQTYRTTNALSPPLLREDESRRFVVDEAVMIPAGNGVVLSAHMARRRDVTAPAPTAMQFTIYTDPPRNRNDALQAAARGYVGIVVDARGKRLGTGAVAPYEREAEDANAAVDWISRQPWSDGRVAMYGGSYLGFATWAAAKHRHPALKTIVPWVAAIPGQGLPMENNVFLSANYAWPFYVANNRLLDDATYDQNERWSALPERWYVSGRPYREIDAVDGTPNPWLQRWLAHPTYDAYWQAMVPSAAELAALDIPVLTITGYYDDGQISALQYYREHHRNRPGADHALLIGPYDHFGAQSSVKARELRGYDVEASAQFDTLAVTFEWIDHVLRGTARPALARDRVNYQLMGADTWLHADSLDAAAGGYRDLYLSNARDGARYTLDARAPGRSTQIVQEVDMADRSSGRSSYYPSPIVRDAIEPGTGMEFVSAPFDTPVDIVGTLSGTLQVRTNKRDFDFMVVLYELMADGRAMQLTYYVGRASHVRSLEERTLLVPGKWTALPFDRSRMTGRRLAAGSRLVVVVDVIKDAWHQVNHGTGGDVSSETVADAGEPLRVEWRNDSSIRLPWKPVEPTRKGDAP